MSEPFIGQIQPLAFNFAPRGWAQCNGQILSISQNTALFSLLGTTYGGNGTTNFALPNLQSRVPLHFGTQPGGQDYSLGEEGGQENVTLNIADMPAHPHAFIGTTAAGTEVAPTAGAALGMIAGTAGNFFYASGAPQPLTASSIGMIGGNQPHSNIQPYLAINWCIALTGIFPQRS